MSGGCKGGVGVLWRSGSGRARAGRPGWLRCGHACRVFDAWSAGSATASAGRVRGQVQGGRVGVLLGSKGKLQDKVVQGLLLVGNMRAWGWHVHASAS